MIIQLYNIMKNKLLFSRGSEVVIIMIYLIIMVEYMMVRKLARENGIGKNQDILFKLCKGHFLNQSNFKCRINILKYTDFFL